MKTIRTVLAVIAAAALAGCSFGTSPEVDNGTPSGFFLSSIDIEAGDMSGTAASGASGVGTSAAVPHWEEDAGITIADGASGTLNNYPMSGQVTRYSVTAVDSPAGEIFRVVSVTSYPYNAHIDNTTETYFLKDQGAVGYVFTDGGGAENSLFREQYSTTYTGDYSIYTRDEEIVWDSITEPDYDFRSRVEYKVSNRNQAFGFLDLTGTREYYNVDGNEERIEITETGRINNMNWNGRIYRGNTDVDGEITLRIVEGAVVEQSIEYTLTHRDLAQPIIITY